MASAHDNCLLLILLGNIVLMTVTAISGYTLGWVLWAYFIECWIMAAFIALGYFYVGARHESVPKGIVKAGSFLFISSFLLIGIGNAAHLEGILLGEQGFSALIIPSAAFLISHGAVFYESVIKKHEKIARTMLDPRGAWNYLLVPLIRISPNFLVSILVLVYWPLQPNPGLFAGFAVMVLLLLKTAADVLIFKLKEESVFV